MFTSITPEKEKWPTTLSVAIVVVNGDRSILLVRKRGSDQWTLPAGGLEKGENGKQAASRELKEETGLNPEDLTASPFCLEDVLFIPGETKTSVGLVYLAVLKKPFPKEGIIIEGDEIDLVRPFSDIEIQELLRHPERIYKPEYNIANFRYMLEWFVGYF